MNILKVSKACFICDAFTTKQFVLATCLTATNKKSIINKLGQLVGDRYMVVARDDDVICQNCALIMDNLDNLETELNSVRSTMLQLMEKKYSLDPGSLNNNNEKSCRPFSLEPITTFSERKELSEEANARLLMDDITSDGEAVWMKCDSCSYTADYSNFVNRHMPDKDVEIKPTDEAVIMDIFSDVEPPKTTPVTQQATVTIGSIPNHQNQRFQQQQVYLAEINGVQQVVAISDPKDIITSGTNDLSDLLIPADQTVQTNYEELAAQGQLVSVESEDGIVKMFTWKDVVPS